MRALAARLRGRRIAALEQRRPDLRFPLPERLAERLIGRRLIGLRPPRQVHPGPSRRPADACCCISACPAGCCSTAPPAGPHEHLTFDFDDGSCLRFVDPRRFGMLDLTPTAALQAHPRLAGLGLEPLDAGLRRARRSRAALAGRQTALKLALMDQRRGGRGRQHLRQREPVPGAAVAAAHRRPACGRARPRGWPTAIRAVLLEAIEAGGSSLRDYVQTDGRARLLPGALCRLRLERRSPAGVCDAPIRRIVQANRATFLCPHCQR